MRDVMMNKLKIIVADQHPLMINGIREFIKCNPDLYVYVGGYNDLSQSVSECNEHKADVFILGEFPNFLTGSELVHWVNLQKVSCKIIAYNTYNERTSVEYANSFFLSGGRGYVWKNSPPEKLKEAIDAVSNDVLYLDDSYIKSEKKIALPQLLTPREKQILQLIADGMTNKEIARHLIISNKTIESHRQNIMKKFDVHNKIELLKTALRLGVCTIF